MWVVRKIGLQTSKRGVAYVQSQFLSEDILGRYVVQVHLQNNETGDYEVLYSNNVQEFFDKLNELHPYGYVNKNKKPGLPLLREVILVAVDDYSLDLWGLVQSVREVRLYQHDALVEFADNLDGVYTACDKERSLFICENVRRCACTLFHAMLNSPSGWHEQGFYLRSRSYFDEGCQVVYRIHFSDYEKTNLMLTKALVVGINPVGQFLSEERV